eukprot:COSAG01_NODE_6406_length_3675_cov_458.417015_2_plen_43_part_00
MGPLPRLTEPDSLTYCLLLALLVIGLHGDYHMHASARAPTVP